MLGNIKKELICGRQVFIYLPPSYNKDNNRFPVLYSHDGEKLYACSENLINYFEEEFTKGNLQEFIWIGIYTDRRNDEYTPWPAPSLVPQFDDFGGKGNEYIEYIVGELKVAMDDTYRTKPDVENSWIMGYSLGGLISIYSAYKTPIFGKIASICGSFWYKDIVKWASGNDILNKGTQLFIHYGKNEGKDKKTVQKNAVLCSEKIIEILKEKSKLKENLDISYDDGGHHQYLVDRYKKAIYWLASK